MREITFKVTRWPGGGVLVRGEDKVTGIMHGRKAPDAETGRQEVRDWFISEEFQRFAAAGGFKV